MKSRRITIELIESDPNNSYGMYGDRNVFDADGKSTRIEMCVDTGTGDTGGGQRTWESKKGHVTPEEAAKIVKKMLTESTTDKKMIFKSLKGITLFGNKKEESED